jgi:LysR family transcriptional regulator (chromosome initiation inhibitor)
VPGQRLPIAVNADSLATWVMPALDALVHAGLSLELVVDDQNFTHDWLREGAVLGCVSTVSEALRGCKVVPLGDMRYLAVASPAFVAKALPDGLNRANFSQVNFLVFNRKDDMQQQWVSHAFGLRKPRLREHFVPSSEAYLRAAQAGWGVGVLPEIQMRHLLKSGELVVLRPDVSLRVRLFWHQWKLGADDASPASFRAAMLDQVGDALALGARKALRGRSTR